MLSTVILYQHSYSTVLLAEQPIHQRLALSGPLVLGKNPFKQQRLRQIETNLSHAYYSHITMCTDYTFILRNNSGDRRVIPTLVSLLNWNLIQFESSLYGVNNSSLSKTFFTKKPPLITRRVMTSLDIILAHDRLIVQGFHRYESIFSTENYFSGPPL